MPHDTNLDVWLIDEFSARYRGNPPGGAQRSRGDLQTYGEEVLGIVARHPAPATGLSTWKAGDAKGYTIPAGTQFTLARTGDELVVFETLAAARIEPETVSVEGVPIVCQEDGTVGNDLFGPGELIDDQWQNMTVEVPFPTINGDEGQSLAEYLNELVMLMRVIALRPILPWDFAILALRVPGVGRAVAMDGYRPDVDFGAAPAAAALADLETWLSTYSAHPEFSEQLAMVRSVTATLDVQPGGGAWGHQREVTLIVTDPDGEPCSQEIKDTIKQTLESLREVNYLVNVIDAEYETIDVEFAVTAYAEQNPDVVLELCNQALALELDPSNFRLGTTSPAIAAGEVIPPPLPDVTPGRQTLHINDYIGLLDRQRGVDWVEPGGVTLNGVAADHVLPGPFHLPRPGVITGTVNVQ